jgi:hypothetical protein
MAGTATAGDGINGRFGQTEIRYIAAKPAVFHNGRMALDIDDAWYRKQQETSSSSRPGSQRRNASPATAC